MPLVPDREAALRSAMRIQPQPEHFTEPKREVPPPKAAAPVVQFRPKPIPPPYIPGAPRARYSTVASHPEYHVRPNCIGAAWRNSFTFQTALTDHRTILDALWRELPLDDNGWSRESVALSRIGDHRFTLSRGS